MKELQILFLINFQMLSYGYDKKIKTNSNNKIISFPKNYFLNEWWTQ